MTSYQRMVRRGIAAMGVMALAGCANGGLGNVLGSVLGSGAVQPDQSGQLSGAITGVDTRAQQVGIQQTNGQTIAVAYDNQTQVVYQNQNYPVTALERGDQVTARLQSTSNGGYYADLIQVNQSVSSGTNTAPGSGQVQAFQGYVRQIDQTNGWFSVDIGNGSLLTVYMPYRPSSGDATRFQNLRRGDNVRFYASIDSNSRAQLRQFY